MWRILSRVGLIFCLIGLMFGADIVVLVAKSTPHGPTAHVAIVVMLLSAILLLPPILGFCVLLKPAGLIGADSGRKRVLWSALALLSVAFTLDFCSASMPYDNSPGTHIAAGEYKAPPGCQITKAKKLSHIPKACVGDNNTIRQASKLGFLRHHANDNWIRIGNDALDAQCTFNSCFVIAVAENKFLVAPESREKKLR